MNSPSQTVRLRIPPVERESRTLLAKKNNDAQAQCLQEYRCRLSCRSGLEVPTQKTCVGDAYRASGDVRCASEAAEAQPPAGLAQIDTAERQPRCRSSAVDKSARTVVGSRAVVAPVRGASSQQPSRGPQPPEGRSPAGHGAGEVIDRLQEALLVVDRAGVGRELRAHVPPDEVNAVRGENSPLQRHIVDDDVRGRPR